MTTPYGPDQVAGLLADRPAWRLGEDGRLHADFSFADFPRALLFVAAVGHLAEAADHHPDLLVHGYRNVRISLVSHDVSGITDRDLRLADRIDRLLQAPSG
jgi:4a-hydroxytetrahydrobiopterin dehydratase